MDVRGCIEENSAGFFDALSQWLAIPSISADPAHHGDVRRSAEWLACYLSQAGFPVAEVFQTGADGSGPPAVFAHWPAADPSAPVVLVYGHHDVQPAEPLDEWDSLPFRPVQRDGQVLARGASGDKGQVLFHVLGAEAEIDLRGPAVAAARRAVEPALGREVLFTREGGSGPEADLAAILGAPLVFLAVGLDSDRVHAPNEKAEMALLLKGAEAAAYLWEERATAAGGLTAAR